MIKSIEQVTGGHRVAFRLNEQAQQPHCWSPVFATLEELYQVHPDLAPAGAKVKTEALAPVVEVATEQPSKTDLETVAEQPLPPLPRPKPKRKRERKGRKRK